MASKDRLSFICLLNGLTKVCTVSTVKIVLYWLAYITGNRDRMVLKISLETWNFLYCSWVMDKILFYEISNFLGNL